MCVQHSQNSNANMSPINFFMLHAFLRNIAVSRAALAVFALQAWLAATVCILTNALLHQPHFDFGAALCSIYSVLYFQEMLKLTKKIKTVLRSPRGLQILHFAAGLQSSSNSSQRRQKYSGSPIFTHMFHIYSHALFNCSILFRTWCSASQVQNKLMASIKI